METVVAKGLTFAQLLSLVLIFAYLLVIAIGLATGNLKYDVVFTNLTSIIAGILAGLGLARS